MRKCFTESQHEAYTQQWWKALSLRHSGVDEAMNSKKYRTKDALNQYLNLHWYVTKRFLLHSVAVNWGTTCIHVYEGFLGWSFFYPENLINLQQPTHHSWTTSLFYITLNFKLHTAKPCITKLFIHNTQYTTTTGVEKEFWKMNSVEWWSFWRCCAFFTTALTNELLHNNSQFLAIECLTV